MSQDKRVSPAIETKTMVQFIWPDRSELSLTAGGVRDVDPRLWLLLHSDKPEYKDLATNCLTQLVSLTPNSSKLFAYLIRAFPEAMRNVNITLQQPITTASSPLMPLGGSKKPDSSPIKPYESRFIGDEQNG